MTFALHITFMNSLAETLPQCRFPYTQCQTLVLNVVYIMNGCI